MASVIRGAGGVLLSLSLVFQVTAEDKVDFPTFTVATLVQGLHQPDGLALHPVTGELYVSEETEGRISVIRGARAVPVIESGFTVVADSPLVAEGMPKPGPDDLRNHLANPEGIAFGPDQSLYVVEDQPGGRLLRFETTPEGRYPRATTLAIPELGDAYAWESVCFDSAGRLYLAGSSYEGNQSWGTSCVISRDSERAWWLVDHGPLASFSALAVSGVEPVLVAGDESVGSLTWWDVGLRREVQTHTRDLGAIEGICMLPDGSVAAAIEHSAHGGRVVRVDPATGSLTVLAEHLGSLESVVYDARTGRLYVTEDSTGRILSLTPSYPLPTDPTPLQLARRSGEAQRGLPPRDTPAFLRNFMAKVGVQLVDPETGDADALRARARRTMTMEELGRRIPLVAGRVTVEEMPDVEDPVTEVSFISLFPNQIAKASGQIIPSLCLFAARHRSGRISHSEALDGIKGGAYNSAQGWAPMPQEKLLMVPLATCSAVQNDNGVTVTLTFLGLGRTEDCFLTINYGRSNDAYFATSGEQLRVAKASFSQRGSNGRESLDFAMTGVRPRRVEDATWLRLMPRTDWTLLSPGVETWVSRRTLAVMPELVAKMRRYNHYIADTLLADAPPSPATPAVADQQQEVNPALPDESRQAEHKPTPPLQPMADLRIESRHDEESESLTNMILSSIVRTWNASFSR